MIHITSDHHFGHGKIIEYENRPFKSIFEMDRVMISLWNQVVRDDDIVIHLGDFSLLPPEDTIEICDELNGRIILFNGNHDHRSKSYWLNRAGIMKWFKRPQYVDGIWLTHRVDWGFMFTHEDDNIEPMRIWTGKKSWTVIKSDDLVLHGHSHGSITQQGQFMNCGVDGWNYMPVPLALILRKRSYNKIADWVKTLC